MKWALICGSSGDIGIQIAKDLANQGWSLYLHYAHHDERIKQLISEFNQQYPRQDFLAVQADFLTADCASKLAASIFGLDAIIFAQGTTYYSLLNAFPTKKIDELLTMQVKTPMLILQKLEAKLAQSNAGRIVFISSIYGKTGSAMEVPYSAVKGAINTFVRAYSKEVASMNITVNAIAPGAVDTQMNQLFDQDTLAQIKSDIPVGHIAKPDEISYWVISLLDERAGYMTGQTLFVNGGWLD